MATSYRDIYGRATNLIDSPKITRAVEENPITFFRIMYPFLLNSFGQISYPEELVGYLQYKKNPEHIIEDFIADGVSNTFNLSFDVEIDHLEDVYFRIEIDGNAVNESDYQYDSNSNSIVFSQIPIEDSKVVVEYYYCGAIIGTNDSSVEIVLKDYSIQLIASFLIRNWLEKAKNRELAIRSNVSPKDYQMFSPANALKENRELYKLAYENTISEQSSFDWRLRYSQAKYGSSYSLVADVKRKK